MSPRFAFRISSLALVLTSIACAGGDGDGGDGDADRTTYPADGYGTGEGDVLENHSFEMVGGGSLSFEDVFLDTDNQLLLVNTAAGWCGACREEQPGLQQLNDEWEAKGLKIVVAVFQDNNSQTADLAFVEQWITEYDLTIDVVLDEPFVLGAYYDASATPMNMLVDVDTMEILKIITGNDKSAIESIISAKLE